jgi:DNA-binding NtrC family response regulator
MPSTPRKVLLVDDEPALLKMMSLYLTRKGYNVTALDSTDRAWAAIETGAGDFTAAVLDATMRGMSSEKLALKLLADNPSLRVLVASGYPVDMSALEKAAPGRVNFIQKPFTPQMLAKTVGNLIGAQEENV